MEKKKAVDIDTYIIGYPCYKPIIRSIRSIGDIPEFERFIFGIGKMENRTDTEMLDMLDGLKQRYLFDSCVLFNADFYDLDEKSLEKKDVPSFILSRKKIKTHSQCAAYYKEFQSNQSACYACKRSPFYKNKYLKEELAILKFMLSGEENCKYVEEKVEKLGIELLGVFDIFFDLRIKTAVYLPLNQWFYTYISNNDSTLFFGSMKKNPEERSSYLFDFFEKDYFKAKDISAEFKRDALKKEVAFRRHLERIEDSCDLTKSDIDELLPKLKAFQTEREDTMNGFSALLPSEKSTYISYTSRTEKKRRTDKEKAEETPAGIEKREQVYLDLNEIYAAANKQTEEPPAEDAPAVDSEPEETMETVAETTDNELSEETPASTENMSEEKPVTESGEDVSFSLCLYNTKKHFVATKQPKLRYGKEDLIRYREINPLIDSAISMEFSLSEEQRNVFRPIKGNLIMLSELEDAALNDKCIAAEAVCTDYGMALVLFTATRHLFAITGMKDEKEKKVIGNMLKRNGLKKVCYNPYLLYAFCYEKGLSINGVHSLLTTHMFLHPDAFSFGLRDLICETVSSNKEYVRDKLKDSTNPLYDSMRYYKRIFLGQERQKKKTNLANLTRMEEFDKAIGCSYRLGGSLNSDERLFVRISGNEIQFNNNKYIRLKNTVRFSGYFATYEFPVQTKHAANIVTRFLCNMSKNNILGEYNIQIVALYKNRITFFIAKEEFDYLDAVIGTTLRSVAAQYGYPLLPLTVIYEYHKRADKTIG